jgi:hypothetical protein
VGAGSTGVRGVKHWKAFGALCGYIRSEALADGPRGKPPRLPWPQLFETAKTHYVMPTLSWCLRDEPAVPAELRSYVDAVLRLNGKRNERLRDSLEHIIRAMNGIDIEPTLLKGVAHLVGGLYPDPAARLMSDLDLLIPKERAPEAVAAMESIGYYVDQVIGETHHHLPLMRHRETNLAIELHTRLRNQFTDSILPGSWVRERSQTIAFRGVQARMPEPTILVAHNVVHDQLNHERYPWKYVELRQLFDLAMIRKRHEPDIDWAELDRRFKSAGLSRVLATYLRYNEVLLGQPMPTVSGVPRTQAMSRLRRAVESPPEGRGLRQRAHFGSLRVLLRRWSTRLKIVVDLPGHYIAARRQDPRGLIRLLSPRAWVRQLIEIGRALKSVS